MSRIQDRIEAFELWATGWMNNYGRFMVRVALGVVFIWFGALKLVDMSPATQLVRDVTWWIPIPDFPFVLGIWEVVIGVCFLFKRTLRLALPLLLLHMPGTALPLILVPEQVWTSFPFGLTIEGQYIVKNLVLVAAALVVGGTVRLRMSGFARFAPEEFQNLLHHGHWGTAEAGTILTLEGAPNDRVYFLRKGSVEVLREGDRINVLGPHRFVGEMSFLTDEPACATVRTLTPVSYIDWLHSDLRRIVAEQPGLGRALHTNLSLDLIEKLRQVQPGEEAQNP